MLQIENFKGTLNPCRCSKLLVSNFIKHTAVKLKSNPLKQRHLICITCHWHCQCNAQHSILRSVCSVFERALVRIKCNSFFTTCHLDLEQVQPTAPTSLNNKRSHQFVLGLRINFWPIVGPCACGWYQVFVHNTFHYTSHDTFHNTSHDTSHNTSYNTSLTSWHVSSICT